MSKYIDGFVHVIPHSKLEQYKSLVEKVADIWKKHGALDYWECVGDDMSLAGTLSFTDLLDVTKDEAVLFGWVVFASREARDLANQAVPADPVMLELMAEVDVGFDAKRMAYAGFKSFVGA